MKIWFGGVCRPSGGENEAWQGVGRAEKYKSGTGNWEIFSWTEPTGKNGALAKLNYKNYCNAQECPKLFAVCVNSIIYFV